MMIREVKKRRFLSVPALILLSFFFVAGVIVDANTAMAGSIGQCMVDRYNTLIANNPVTDLNCTSNDVMLATYALVSGPTSCLPGDNVTVVLKGQFVATASERYDVGVFVGLEGANPNAVGGSCYDDILHPVSTTNTDLDLTGGAGPFYNGELTVDPGDLCGDIQQDNDAFLLIPSSGTITIKCQDSNGDNIADVDTCTVWANSTSDGDKKPSCLSEADTTAETSAKCTCENVPISGLTVPFTGTIEVKKVLSPSTDSGKFNLQVDGVTKASDVGDGGTTGAVTVSAGTNVDPGDDHTGGEIAGTGTSLGDYTSSITCTNGTTTLGPTAGTSMTVTVNKDDAWVCTITNTVTDKCANVDCNDNNACTTDTCDPATGQCNHSAISCDDSNACTTDTCDAIAGCQHSAISCNDNNACTADTCDIIAGCQHSAISCDDNNVCTTDTCDTTSGCQHTPISCNDGNACTVDTCDAISGCQHAALSCEDNNACTADSCNPASGCVHTAICVCDTNSDGKINIVDTNKIYSLRGQPASVCPVCDADGNGTITTLDQKICISRCTKPNCAP